VTSLCRKGSHVQEIPVQANVKIASFVANSLNLLCCLYDDSHDNLFLCVLKCCQIMITPAMEQVDDGAQYYGQSDMVMVIYSDYRGR